MLPKYVIEHLDRRRHDRDAFFCESEALNRYLKQQAHQDSERNVAAIYILRVPDSLAVLGYYTLCTTSIVTQRLPETIKKRLPRYEALPAILIGRLARDERVQGQGIGALLLSDALKRCWRLSNEIGAMAVVVSAIDERAANFYEGFGFRRFADTALHLFLPMAEIGKLLP